MTGPVTRRDLFRTGGALAVASLTNTAATTTANAADVGPFAVRSGRITVDASTGLGTFFNPASYINHTHPNWYLSQNPDRGPLPPKTLAQLRDDFNVRWARISVKANSYYDPGTGGYDLAANHPAFDQASAYANRLVVNFTSSISMEKTPELWEDIMRTTLLDLKARYPTIDCVLPWIEPDLGIVGGHPDGSPLTPAEFYAFYAAGYRAVHTVNTQLDPQIPLTYGGPETSNLTAADETWIGEFLRRYVADTDPRKRLDFLAVNLYHLNRGDPRQVVEQRATLRRLLREAGLPEYLPPYITEYGVYPGSDTGDRNGASDAEDLAHDQLVQAAGVAALGRYFIESGMNRPIHWVINHGENQRKDMFVEGMDGVRLPFGHTVVMQGMLKDTYGDGERLATTLTPDASDNGGIGLGAVAHVDSAHLTVMYWNYQAESGPDTYDAVLHIRNLPNLLAGKRIRVASWLVDATHNNYNHDRTAEFTPNALFTYPEPVTEIKRRFSIGKNAVGLLRFTPAS